jgi:hypothetical protein
MTVDRAQSAVLRPRRSASRRGEHRLRTRLARRGGQMRPQGWCRLEAVAMRVERDRRRILRWLGGFLQGSGCREGPRSAGWSVRMR